MQDFFSKHFNNLIQALYDEGRFRSFIPLSRQTGKHPKALRMKEDSQSEVTIWCSNDYLGMSQNQKVIDTMKDAIDSNGAGSGGTRNISGTHTEIVALESEIAAMVDKEAALVFSSGYVANETALSTLGKSIPDVIILSDADNHASMILGIKHSGAEKKVFRHNDLNHLENILKSLPLDRPKLIAFESVYSMDGDIGHIEEICILAKKYNALTFLDETHGVGLYGERGGGVAQQRGISHLVDIIQGGLGKGVGVVGGYIAANKEIVEVIRSYGAGFIFTTSLPPAVAAAARASIKQFPKMSLVRAKLHRNVDSLKQLLREADIPFIENPSHIVPVMIGDSRLCKQVSDYLLEEESIYIQPINYPTVPRGTERLRVTPSPLHTEEQMQELVTAFKNVWEKYSIQNVDCSHLHIA